jgi:hypothetical protein
MLLFATDAQHPSRIALLGTDTLGELRTHSAICARELDPDDLVLVPIHTGCPTSAPFALGTRRSVLLPINLELCGGKTGLLACLPPIVQACRPKQVDTILILTFHQQRRVKETCVDN